MRQPRGFFTTEAIIGMALLTIIGGALAVAITGQQRVDRRLADQHQALAAAEAALLSLQSHQPIPAGPEISVTVTDLPCTSGHWVRVTATLHKASADLVGLVPQPAGGAQ